MSDDFAIALSKIRPHTNSKLEHQRKPAQLVVALESTLQETINDSSLSMQTPTAYFAALITTLEGCISRNDITMGDGDTLPAVLYLLALVLPYVPQAVIRSNMSKIFQLVSPLLLLTTSEHAPPLRSMIGIFGTTMNAMDQALVFSTLSSSTSLSSNVVSSHTTTATSIRQTFSTLLELTIDPRPKVRKRASEVVKSILDAPPTPLAIHPWSTLVAEWSCSVIAQAAETGAVLAAAKKGGNNEGVERIIHLLAFLRTVPVIFSAGSTDEKADGKDSALEVMVRYLLAMPKLANAYLTQSSYQLLTSLLISEEGEEEEEDDIWTQRRQSQAQTVLKTLVSNVPPKQDAQIAPYWLAAVAQATVASRFTKTNDKVTSQEVLNIWKIVWSYLDSSCTGDTRGAAKNALEAMAIGRCLAVEEMRGFSDSKEGVMMSIVELIIKSLSQLVYVDSVQEILEVSTTLAEVSSPLRGGIEAPEKFHKSVKESHPLIRLMETTVKLRNTKGFEHKDAVDRFLGAMIGAIGVDGVLKRLSLGLLPSERNKNTQPNAYLLPLIPAHHPTPLSHFADYFIPLSESLWELTEKSEKEAEKKVYRVLMEQIWNTFPSYCWGTWDLKQTFTPKLAERLTQVLYHEPTLRPPILRGLKIIVETNANILKLQSTLPIDSDLEAGDDEDETDLYLDNGEAETSKGSQDTDIPLISEDDARQNIEYLNKQAKSWLAVLFNVFTGMEKDSRGVVGEVISAWAAIANETELAGAYRNVLTHLNQNLSSLSKATRKTPNPKEIKTTHQMLEILLLLVPYLPLAQLKEVLGLFLQQKVLVQPDSGIQKVAYRVLGRVLMKIAENEDIPEQERKSLVERVLTEAGDGVEIATGAIKERLSFLASTFSYLQPTSLHLLVAYLMEAIMGVKEHSEKARKAAFDLLVVMGEKMSEGGTIRMDLVNEGDGMEAEGMEREANVEEFVKMVAASLAADRDHTISAGIMSLSRVLFEFKDEVSEETQSDIVATVYPLLGVKNREVVKSVLGFVKLSIHSLSTNVVHPQLPTLVPSLMTCLQAHGHHFKVKIRHIFERLLRKYGAEEIERYALTSESSESGGLKMLLNIKKRKERAARKRREAATQGEDEDVERPKAVSGDAFDDVLYGSESEIEDSEVEQEERAERGPSSKRRKGQNGMDTRLRVDDDEPMDLLAGITGKLSRAQNSKRRRPGQDASKFKTDEDTGKMVIEESESETEQTTPKSKSSNIDAGDALAGAAYKENLVSVDGFTRNPRGVVKFHKDTKKRRREEMEMEDVEMEDATNTQKNSAGKKKKARVGQEFRAKKAGGDIKRNGVDPYAYLTLGQTAGGRKGKGRVKVSIVGK